MDETSASMTIQLDENTKLFYAGAAAGSRIAERLTGLKPSFTHEQKLRYFWLQVGIELIKAIPDEDDHKSEIFLTGAGSRLPGDPAALRLHIDRSALEAYEDDETEDRARTDLRALLETVAQRIQDGADSDRIWNSAHVARGAFTLAL